MYLFYFIAVMFYLTGGIGFAGGREEKGGKFDLLLTFIWPLYLFAEIGVWAGKRYEEWVRGKTRGAADS